MTRLQDDVTEQLFKRMQYIHITEGLKWSCFAGKQNKQRNIYLVQEKTVLYISGYNDHFKMKNYVKLLNIMYQIHD